MHSAEAGYDHDHARNPYAGYEASEGMRFPVSNRDERLPQKDFVSILPVGDAFKAYRWNDLLSLRAINGEVGRRALTRPSPPTTNPSRPSPPQARRIVGFHAFWFSAAAVHTGIRPWTAV